MVARAAITVYQRLVHRSDVSRRARRVDAEVRVARLAAGPHGAVAAHERRGVRVEALRARDSARRQRPRGVRVDGREVRAPRERVEQVRQVRWVEPAEVDRRERAGAERVAHRAHAAKVAQTRDACEVRAAVEQVDQVQVRERDHVVRERHARQVLAVGRACRARPGCEAEAHVLADRADATGGAKRARRIGRRARRQHRLAVVVEVRPEPRACVGVRVGEHAAGPDLAHARSARAGGHEAVRASHELVAPVEHERAREPHIAERGRIDRLERGAAAEHLRRARDAGKVLEAGDLGHALERVEQVVRLPHADLHRFCKANEWIKFVLTQTCR